MSFLDELYKMAANPSFKVDEPPKETLKKAPAEAPLKWNSDKGPNDLQKQVSAAAPTWMPGNIQPTPPKNRPAEDPDLMGGGATPPVAWGGGAKPPIATNPNPTPQFARR